MRLSLFLLAIVSFGCIQKDIQPDLVITQDIDNFWNAFDQVNSTKDSTEQRAFLKEYFLDNASNGQKAMIDARNYSVDEYISAINNFPEFWNSIRNSSLKASEMKEDLQLGIGALKSIYPSLSPAKIYFTIGALRSNGTTMDSMVLIGSELAFADSTTIISELLENFSHLESYFNSNPASNLVFLNTHEYIHTQQKTTIGNTLLAQTVLEGVAEFLTEIALDKDSPNPQLEFGRQNDKRLKSAFEAEMFSPFLFNWIWNSPDNEFGMRDLAYYIGYKISEGYYNHANDKSVAIEEMIELDYNNEVQLIQFVDKSAYFSTPITEFKNKYENTRPRVVNVHGIGEESKPLESGKHTIRIEFSEAMDVNRISTDLGALGLDHFPKIERREFVGGGHFLEYDVILEANKRYEMVIHWNMRNLNGNFLIPDTLRFRTR